MLYKLSQGGWKSLWCKCQFIISMIALILFYCICNWQNYPQLLVDLKMIEDWGLKVYRYKTCYLWYTKSYKWLLFIYQKLNVRSQITSEIQILELNHCYVNKIASLRFVYKKCKVREVPFVWHKCFIANNVNWFSLFINNIINRWGQCLIETYTNATYF